MSDLPFKPPLAAGVVEHAPDQGYIPPGDRLSRERLEHWQDLKFGLIMHWGLYTDLALDGSWSLCRANDEEAMLLPDWFDGDEDAWYAFYQASRTSFGGEAYDARRWADAAERAGARYLVFTSKHHDGFAMFDTAQSDFKVTGPGVPLGRDILRETFDAFRAKGIETGVYFSKADWAHPGYWSPEAPIVDRFHNYDVGADPERWESFVDFTHAQVEELLTGYGDISVLWLDAGWVFAPGEDLRITELADRARQLQPGILVVDREVHGPNEDYRTPEQQVPTSRLDHPWESCVTLLSTWCTIDDDEPKPTIEVVRMLVTVVARGGNLLLGVGPGRDGVLPERVDRSLAEIGAWLALNGDAIYGTRPVTAGVIAGNGNRESWLDDRGRTWWLTESPDAVHLLSTEGTADRGPLRVPLSSSVRSVRLLGGAGELPWKRDADGLVTVQLPESLPEAFAIAFDREGAR